ncbi:mutator family transposase [Kutzneria buriramensis]|uniref:Mutator family transposase n=1 Tax=Kutzneria buriramensis TaxID=1045776 RepID=A0A3E0G8B1_9PSEU|nr:mutator family transposase [Kutzneria buriramensis]
MLSVVNDGGITADSLLIDEIVREGARRMLAAALEAEVTAYIAELADQRDETGRRLVARNGYHQPRQVTTAAGAVEVKAPRVNDKRVNDATGERKRFSSAILVRAETTSAQVKRHVDTHGGPAETVSPAYGEAFDPVGFKGLGSGS